MIRWGAFEGVSDPGQAGQADSHSGTGSFYEEIRDPGLREA